jgi:hypothetical protein
MSNKPRFEIFIEANKSYSDIFFNKKIVGFEVIYKFATIKRSKS